MSWFPWREGPCVTRGNMRQGLWEPTGQERPWGFLASIPFLPVFQAAWAAGSLRACLLTHRLTASLWPHLSSIPGQPRPGKGLPAGLHLLTHTLLSNLHKETSLQLWFWFLFQEASSGSVSSSPESSVRRPLLSLALRFSATSPLPLAPSLPSSTPLPPESLTWVRERKEKGVTCNCPAPSRLLCWGLHVRTRGGKQHTTHTTTKTSSFWESVKLFLKFIQKNHQARIGRNLKENSEGAYTYGIFKIV